MNEHTAVLAARLFDCLTVGGAGYNDRATAEVALMLMLMLARRADAARRAFQQRIVGEPAGSE